LAHDAGDPGAVSFPTTQWSEIARAADVDPQAKRAALGRLLATYLPALRAHLVIQRRLPADRADDVLQSFICDQVVADDLVSRADRMRGRFRTFVLVALDRYAARVHRHDTAQKRSPEAPLVSLDDVEAVHGDADAASEFDLAWARQVVLQAIATMREQCMSDGGRRELWTVFETCALAPLFDNAEAPPLKVVAEQLGLNSPQQVSNLLVTAKRTFARVLGTIVGEYAQDADEIDLELRDLWKILSRGR
jgi:hypothetical protein